MRVLLDENVDVLLKSELPGHDVVSVSELGWHGIDDTELLRRARGSYDVLITHDRGLLFQHSHREHDLRIVVLRMPKQNPASLIACLPALKIFLGSAPPGAMQEIHAEPRA